MLLIFHTALDYDSKMVQFWENTPVIILNCINDKNEGVLAEQLGFFNWNICA